MKPDFILNISKLWLVPDSELYDGIQADEIAFKAKDMEPEDFTPGTAFYNAEKKSTSSGFYYSHEIVFSCPGLQDPAYATKINGTGAVVTNLDTGRTIVMRNNDFFSNAPFASEISSSLGKTSVKFTISSLDFL